MSLIRKPHELEVSPSVIAGIYGQPGLGKTTLGLSAPSPLLLDFDRGAHRVRPDHLKETVQVKSWQDVLDVQKEDLSSFKTILIDTAGQLLDFMGAYIIKNNPKMGRGGALTLQGYGERKVMFQQFVMAMRTLGKHLIFIAHDKEEKEGDTKIIRPEIGGSSSGDLIKQLDLVGYMEARDKVRTISFDPCEKFYGKNTCGLDAIYPLPDVTKVGNDFMTRIFDRFADSLKNRNAMASDYKRIMEEVSAKLAIVADADMANDFITWAQTVPHLWDSSMQARVAITSKAKTLGLSFNPTAKIYEAPKAAPVAEHQAEVAHAA